ncbi:hypothetical protein Tco_0206978 [Tanacetum coccineum]
MGEDSVIPTDSHHIPIITEPLTSQPQKKQKPRKPKRKDTEVPQPSGPINEAINEEHVSKHSHVPLLSGEDSIQLKELMDFYTKLQQRVLDLKNTKIAQAQEISSLKLRVKKLEKKGGSRTHKLMRLYKVGLSAKVISSEEESLGEEDASKQGRKIHDIDANKDITLENVHDAEMFDVNDLHGDEVFVEKEVHVKEVSVVGEVNAARIATTVSAAIITEVDMTLDQVLAELKSAKPKFKVQDKGKGIMVEEPLKMKKKDQISFYQQEAIRLQAEFDEDERRVREKDEANIALTKEWNDIQTKIETEYELAQRLQAMVQEELTKAKAKVIEGSSKRAGDELEQEATKNQKIDDDQETAELQSMMEVIPNEEEVAVDAIPLAIKPPSIVDWKIIKEGNISYYQIIRADGSLKMYSSMIQMLKSFDREYLETLWKLVKAKHGSTRPEEGYERVL